MGKILAFIKVNDNNKKEILETLEDLGYIWVSGIKPTFANLDYLINENQKCIHVIIGDDKKLCL